MRKLFSALAILLGSIIILSAGLNIAARSQVTTTPAIVPPTANADVSYNVIAMYYFAP